MIANLLDRCLLRLLAKRRKHLKAECLEYIQCPLCGAANQDIARSPRPALYLGRIVLPVVNHVAPVKDAIDKDVTVETERRRKLLDEYKTATGNPSNKKIYEADNSYIHKPQFYEWLDGRLPVSSVTTINFERFLREKKCPFKGGR